MPGTYITGENLEPISESNPINVAEQPTVIPMTATGENAAIQITQDGEAGKSWYITYMNWRVSGSAAVGASNLPVTLKDGSTNIYLSAIPAASANGTHLEITFSHPIKITAGNSFSYDIATPNNAGCILYANLGAFKR